MALSVSSFDGFRKPSWGGLTGIGAPRLEAIACRLVGVLSFCLTSLGNPMNLLATRSEQWLQPLRGQTGSACTEESTPCGRETACETA